MMKQKNILVFAALAALVTTFAVYGTMQYIHTEQEEKQLRMAISGYTAAGEALLDATRVDTANEGEYAWRYRQVLQAAGAVKARWDTSIGMRFGMNAVSLFAPSNSRMGRSITSARLLPCLVNVFIMACLLSL